MFEKSVDWIILIGVVLFAIGLTVLLIVAILRARGKVDERQQGVLEYAETRSYEFLDRTSVNLAKLRRRMSAGGVGEPVGSESTKARNDWEIYQRLGPYILGEFHESPANATHWIQNVMVIPRDGFEQYVFDHKTRSSPSGGTSTIASIDVSTLTAMKSPRLSLPRFTLMGSLRETPPGMPADINFDSHPVFSEKYYLYGVSEREIRRFFTPGLLEFLEKQEECSLQGSGDLLVDAGHGLVDVADLDALVQDTAQFFAALLSVL